MPEMTEKEFTQGAGKPITGFIALPKAVGVDQVFGLLKCEINKDISDIKKFSVKDKDGTPLGWNYRFTTEQNGQEKVWDVNKKALFGPCLTWLYTNGLSGGPTPVKVRLFRKAEKKSERESIYGVEQLQA